MAVPQTFSELIEAAQTFREAVITPSHGMLADSWTAQSVAELRQLFEYTWPDPLSKGYEDGTTAFARGESAMLLLGSYAVPRIRLSKRDFTIGRMALPATEDPSRTTLVSGVDVVLTAARESENPEVTDRFLKFLMQEKVVSDYCRAQVAVPTLGGLSNDDPAPAGVGEYIESGRIVGFTDHQFIPAIPLAPLLQSFLIGGDEQTFVRDLDSDWDKVAGFQGGEYGYQSVHCTWTTGSA